MPKRGSNTAAGPSNSKKLRFVQNVDLSESDSSNDESIKKTSEERPTSPSTLGQTQQLLEEEIQESETTSEQKILDALKICFLVQVITRAVNLSEMGLLPLLRVTKEMAEFMTENLFREVYQEEVRDSFAIIYLMIKKALKELDSKKLKNYGATDLFPFLSRNRYYTIFIDFPASDLFEKKFIKSYLSKPDTKIPFGSSCQNTETTSTSSTRASTSAQNADVRYQENSEISAVDSYLDNLFTSGISHTRDGLISQSIYALHRDGHLRLSSPGEPGYGVIKLDYYPVRKIKGLPRTDWWRHADFRITAVTDGPLDPKEKLTRQLIMELMKSVEEVPNVEKVSVKNSNLPKEKRW